MRNEYPDFKRDEQGRLLRGENGRLLCRGCGIEVPKGRQTWCSRECFEAYEPGEVRHTVWTRDKGICQRCAKDLIELYFEKYPHVRRNLHGKLKSPYGCDVHFDHIIPWSEGGKTTTENMRTLCIPCHKEITAEWHRERAKKRRPQMELAL